MVSDSVTSLQVAEHFGKEHFNVLNDIRRTIDKCSESFNALNFQAVEYTDAKGEKRPMYLLSKDGFMMVAMAYITPEAMRIKEAYIARFNEMEEQLRTTSLQVATHFGKNHKDVLRDIRVTIEKCSQEFNECNFAPVEYTDAKGKRKPPFLDRFGGFALSESCELN